MTTRNKTQTSAIANRERRLVVLSRLLGEGKSVNEYAKETGISYKTAKKDWKLMKNKLEAEAKDAIVDYKEDQLVRIASKWDEIESSKTMTDAEKHQAWARWMKLEMDLRGTAAPQKHLVGMAIPIRLGEELRAVVSQLDESQIECLVLHARGILNGEIGDGDKHQPIPIQLIPPANLNLGFDPQVIEQPSPLPRRRSLPAQQPKELPPTLEAGGAVEEEGDWMDQFGDMTR